MGIRTSEVKQPREIIRKGIDFTGNKKLASGDQLVLVGSSVVVTDEDGQDKTSEMVVTDSLEVDIPNNTISALIQAGTSGQTYTVTFLAATEGGELLEEDIALPVENLTA